MDVVDQLLPLEGVVVEEPPARVVQSSATLREASRKLPPLDCQQQFVDGRFLPKGAWLNVVGQSTQYPDHRHLWREEKGDDVRRHRMTCIAMLPPVKPGEEPRPCEAVATWDQPSIIGADPAAKPESVGLHGSREWRPGEMPWKLAVLRWFAGWRRDGQA
jgi:hypothetical protein